MIEKIPRSSFCTKLWKCPRCGSTITHWDLPVEVTMKVKITRKGDTRIFTGVKSFRKVQQDNSLIHVDMQFDCAGAINCLERGSDGYVGSISMKTDPDGMLGMDDCEKIEVFEETED